MPSVYRTTAQAIIRANLEGDYSALIRTRPVAQWRETLAMLVTYTDRDKFRGLADTLASRLAQVGQGGVGGEQDRGQGQGQVTLRLKGAFGAQPPARYVALS